MATGGSENHKNYKNKLQEICQARPRRGEKSDVFTGLPKYSSRYICEREDGRGGGGFTSAVEIVCNGTPLVFYSTNADGGAEVFPRKKEAEQAAARNALIHLEFATLDGKGKGQSVSSGASGSTTGQAQDDKQLLPAAGLPSSPSLVPGEVALALPCMIRLSDVRRVVIFDLDGTVDLFEDFVQRRQNRRAQQPKTDVVLAFALTTFSLPQNTAATALCWDGDSSEFDDVKYKGVAVVPHFHLVRKEMIEQKYVHIAMDSVGAVCALSPCKVVVVSRDAALQRLADYFQQELHISSQFLSCTPDIE